MNDPVIIGDATLYHGDCLEILPALDKVDVVVTDPPYGILSDTGSAATRRSGGNKDNGVVHWDKSLSVSAVDAVISSGRSAFVWGGCHMPLPPTFGYLIWDKVCDGLNFGEVEFCWSTEKFAPRKLRERAAGMDGGKQHPTQKPVRVMEWCLSFAPNGDVLDPFMGSGTTGVACANLGRKFIGVEIEKKYFDIACERIDAAYAQGRLFA